LSLSPEEQVEAARALMLSSPDKPELRLDLIAALLQAGHAREAEIELDGLPANLATDDRAKRARAQLDFAKALQGAPGESELAVDDRARRARAQLARATARQGAPAESDRAAALTAHPNNHRARHQRGVRRLLAGDHEAALECFLAIMRADRKFDDDLGRKSLIA